MQQGIALLLLLALGTTVSACKHDAKITVDAPPSAAPAPSSRIAVPATITDVTLPMSTNVASDVSPVGLRVYVGRKEVAIGDPPHVVAAVPADATHGLDATVKRNGPADLYITPIAAAVPKDTHEAVVYFDRDTPYRLFVEVLFTLGQSEIRRYHIVASGAQPGSLSTLDVDPPKASSALAKQTAEPRLGAVILVSPDGLSVKTRGGNIAVGCKDTGPGVAVPRVGDKHDFAGLTACLTRLKAAAPQFGEENDVTISANPTIHAQEVIATMDAARGSADAGILFPTVVFGVAR